MTPKYPPPTGQITPPAGPRIDTVPRTVAGAALVLTADFIYWQMQEENLVIGEPHDNSFSGNTQITTIKTGTLDFKYTPGFKVGAGVIFDHDNWDLFANYTWLKQNHAHGSISGTVIKDLRVLGTHQPGQSGPPGFLNEHAKWTCYFNNIDLGLGRQFFISKDLILRPHFGLKGSWINQRFSTLIIHNYTDGSLLNQHTCDHQDFWGIGLRAGLNTAWHFTRNWSIYGDIAASELASNFKSRSKSVSITTEQSINNTDIYLSTHSFYTITPVLEVALGVRYEMLFSQDRYQFFVQAGWEQQVWWDQNQLIVSTENGKLTLQGLDVKLGFAF